MTAPALSIRVGADLADFKAKMQETSALAGSATKQIAKHFIDANASALAAAGGIGQTALGLRSVLGVMGPLAVAVTAVSGVFKLMSTATELAKDKIEEFSETAARAASAGVSTDFFQRFTKSGEQLKSTIGDVGAALDRFAAASQGKLGGSDIEKRLAELRSYGNLNDQGVAAVGNAVGTEAKLRAVVALIDDALAKGQRLAALDIADRAFGPKVADNLRSNSAYLREMLATADKLSASKIISEEEIGRAIDLKNRLEDAQKVLADRFKPIQNDLAQLGMNYQQSWVDLYQNMAKAVGVANDLYAALKEIPAIFAAAGSAPFWSRLTELTGKLGLNATPESMGLQSITSTGEGSPANRQLAALMNNPAALRRAMQEAIDVETKVRGDASRPPPKPETAASRARDPFESALDQGERRIAVMDAETRTIGLNSEARERGRIVAILEESAKRANAAAGRELYGVTEASNPKIAEQADKMLAAARAAREQQAAFDGLQSSLQYAGNELVNVLDSMSQRGANFGQVMAGVFRNLSRQMLMAAITGQGAFAQMLGMASGNGGVGGLLGFVSRAFTGGMDANPGSSANPLPGLTAADYGEGFADGGMISGPGTGRSDSILARLSNGEFVVTADATARHRPLLEAINSDRLPRFADGGAIGGIKGGALALGNSLTVAPTINVSVGGGSQGRQADEALARQIGQQVEASVRAIVGKELRQQSRPGGTLYR